MLLTLYGQSASPGDGPKQPAMEISEFGIRVNFCVKQFFKTLTESYLLALSLTVQGGMQIGIGLHQRNFLNGLNPPRKLHCIYTLYSD